VFIVKYGGGDGGGAEVVGVDLGILNSILFWGAWFAINSVY